jgi:O-antigen/teichoic acid export membrane protein
LLRANLRNILFQSAAQIIPRAILFLFTFYLARILGSNEYGKYDFALSIGYLLGVFYELGGNLILTKYVARGHYSIFGFSLRFRLVSIFTTIGVAFGLFIIAGIYTNVIHQILFASLGIAFSSLMNLYFAFFRGVREMGYEAAVLIVQKLLFIALCLLFIVKLREKFDSQTTLLAFTASMLISWLLIQYIFLRSRKRFTEDKDKKKIKTGEYIKDIFTLALAEVFAILYFRVTQIVLESFTDFHEVGVYGVSSKLVEAVSNIPAILMLALFPSFAELARRDRKEFRAQFKTIFLLLIVSGITASALCWTLGESIFSLIGKDYGEAYIIVRYMIIALMFIFPNYLLTHAMVALDLNLKYAGVLFSVLLLNIILSVFLVPLFQARGSAVSVGLCEMVIFAFTLYFVNKETKAVAYRET